MRCVVLLFCVAGCIGKPSVNEVREYFSKSDTCPLERVEVRERPEVKASRLESSSSPPADISADPRRLEMWQADHDKQNAYTDAQNLIYEVRGCGMQMLLGCHRMKSGSVTCHHNRKYPDGVAKW